MSNPFPPPEPPRPGEPRPSGPSEAAGEEFDLPYPGVEPVPPRLARMPPGAVRAFLFLTAAYLIGAGAGQSLGLLLAVMFPRARALVHGLAHLWDALPDLVLLPEVVFCIGGVSLLLMLVVTLAFTRAWERRPLNSAGFQVDGRAGTEFAAGLVLGAALMAAIFAVERGQGWLRIASVLPFPRALARAALWFGALLPAAAAEEVMLRGYTFQALKEQWGGVAATLLTAIVFSALHNLNPHAGWPSFAGIFVAGILFGTAVLVTGRLWLPIGLHVAWNLFEGPVLGFPVSGIQFPGDLTPHVTGPPLWTGGAFGPEAGLLGVFASAAGVLVLLAIRRKA
jgi:CAAX protease family protein